jgi:hypothetical protein
MQREGFVFLNEWTAMSDGQEIFLKIFLFNNCGLMTYEILS